MESVPRVSSNTCATHFSSGALLYIRSVTKVVSINTDMLGSLAALTHFDPSFAYDEAGKASIRLDGSGKDEPGLPASIPVSPVSSVRSGGEVHRAGKVVNHGDRERETQYLPEEGVFRMDPSDGDGEVSGANGSLLWRKQVRLNSARNGTTTIPEHSHFDYPKSF